MVGSSGTSAAVSCLRCDRVLRVARTAALDAADFGAILGHDMVVGTHFGMSIQVCSWISASLLSSASNYLPISRGLGAFPRSLYGWIHGRDCPCAHPDPAAWPYPCIQRHLLHLWRQPWNHIKKGQNLAANSPSPTQEMNLNLSASLNVFKLLANPSLCLPHAIVPTFKDLPIPLDSAFKTAGAKVEIKAIVLDKDDCFAVPETSEVYKPYQVC